jgi:hypothetical protein
VGVPQRPTAAVWRIEKGNLTIPDFRVRTSRTVEMAAEQGVERDGRPRTAARALTRAPSTHVILGVQVPPKEDHPERSELQLRKGDQSWGGSGERNRGPMNKNRIGGGAAWDERARCREVSMVKAQAT